jgi:hypothetical protein
LVIESERERVLEREREREREWGTWTWTEGDGELNESVKDAIAHMKPRIVTAKVNKAFAL